MHYISQLSLYVRCVPGMAVRDGELVALLHRLEDMAGRDTNPLIHGNQEGIVISGAKNG